MKKEHQPAVTSGSECLEALSELLEDQDGAVARVTGRLRDLNELAERNQEYELFGTTRMLLIYLDRLRYSRPVESIGASQDGNDVPDDVS